MSESCRGLFQLWGSPDESALILSSLTGRVRLTAPPVGVSLRAWLRIDDQ